VIGGINSAGEKIGNGARRGEVVCSFVVGHGQKEREGKKIPAAHGKKKSRVIPYKEILAKRGDTG